MSLIEAIRDFYFTMGFSAITWQEGVMLLVSFVLIYLALKKGFEPLLLLPIAFGMLLANLPLAGLNAEPVYQLVTDPVTGEHVHKMVDAGGLLYWLYRGVKLGIYPPLIFLGVGAMTDFGPLIANPKSILLGAAAQFGIFTTFIGALLLNFIPGISFTIPEAASIGIIGGADGPTAIYLTAKLAPHLLGPIAVAAYSYMALVPLIQPPIMKALTTKAEREIVMEQLRPVSKVEKIVFPILVTVVVSLVLPAAASLVGMLMLGNLLREAATMQSTLHRLMKTAEGELMNIVVIFLGVTVGATANGALFLSPKTLAIIALGLAAFSMGTAAGVLFGKVMCKLSGGKVNPLIGSAGVSAVPMAARVSQKVGQEANPSNFLLMHAMGPNVAGVIGSAVAAGVLLSMCAM
ncbi:sodium ion-translocating decarboxylase subunit beta [Lutispora saccharofermentans]|uniref:Sodium ion-translocating decarboxylase subunit beta n=1 Tax=Lutispora saccharofermentans TaxID=3024236 RepID=A0ABT1NJ13_9FIRM|nr:sodium ion-translocating decarboxylase subunit beta [Lutispora saccharofermentans]MCQ1530569.1 sodium ion-translocating decarboxylase subunit beta [Lutispora saccharofermentans]